MMLVLQYSSFNLTESKFLSKKYKFNKDNLYVKNISRLIFFLSKIESIFSINIVLNKMQYKFENEMILKMLEKFVMVAINLLICYLIVKVSYMGPLLITKLIFIGIEFEVLRKTSYIYNGLAMSGNKKNLDNVF